MDLIERTIKRARNALNLGIPESVVIVSLQENVSLDIAILSIEAAKILMRIDDAEESLIKRNSY
jgi:hypothetical protein